MSVTQWASHVSQSCELTTVGSPRPLPHDVYTPPAMPTQAGMPHDIDNARRQRRVMIPGHTITRGRTRATAAPTAMSQMHLGHLMHPGKLGADDQRRADNESNGDDRNMCVFRTREWARQCRCSGCTGRRENDRVMHPMLHSMHAVTWRKTAQTDPDPRQKRCRAL